MQGSTGWRSGNESGAGFFQWIRSLTIVVFSNGNLELSVPEFAGLADH